MLEWPMYAESALALDPGGDHEGGVGVATFVKADRAKALLMPAPARSAGESGRVQCLPARVCEEEVLVMCLAAKPVRNKIGAKRLREWDPPPSGAALGSDSGASLICGISQSEGTLLVARGLQGLGGAMVSPAALSIILTTFAEGSERNRALAVWGAIAGAGGAVGLLLGGLIVEVLSWRWVFFVNVPIGAVVLALAPRIVPESRSESVSEGGYDAEGAVAITLGTIALVFTLIKADSWGWTSGRTLAGFAIAAVLIVAFVFIERRHRDPLIPLRSSPTAVSPPPTRRCSWSRQPCSGCSSSSRFICSRSWATARSRPGSPTCR
jgi:MFS family permease